MWYCWKNRQTDQENRRESPETDPYNQLIFDREAKAIQWSKDNLFNKRYWNNIGENLGDLGYSDDFLDTTPKAQSMKEIIDKLDFIKIKNFCSVKDNIKREWKKKREREATDLKKIFSKDKSDKGLLAKIIPKKPP